MARLLLYIGGTGVLLAAGYLAARAAGWKPSGRELASPAAADRPEAYRNHLAMARWIESLLADEMVRPLLDPAAQDRARGLLEAFYGEES